MATPFDELLEEGAAKRNAPVQSGSPLQPLVDKLSFDEFLQFGQQRRTGTDDVTALQNVFGEGRTVLGEFPRGVQRGVEGLGDVGLGLGALGAGALGFEETVGNLGERIGQRQFERGITNAPLQQFEGAFDTPGNFTAWLAGVLGEQTPNIASIIAGGGAGTLIGRALAQRAITRETASRAMAFTIRNSGEIGVFGAATALETGSTATEQLGATGTVDVPVAVIAGVVKGSLEGLTPLAVGRSFGIIDDQLQSRFLQTIANKVDDLRSRPTKALVSAIQTAPLEGATEYLQEAVDLAARTFVDENFDALSSDSRKRLLESAVTGAFVGGGFGGFAGALAPQRGVPADAPLATFTEEEGAIVVEPTDSKPLPVEPINENVPFVFTDESGVAKSQDFANGIRGFQREALENVRGNEVRRFFRVENIEDADTSALLEDLPTTPDAIESEAGVSFQSEALQTDAITKVQEAILQRNFALESAATNNADGPTQLARARELYQEALDLGFRMEPREGNGFTLVGEAQLREVTYEPSSFIGTPFSRFGRKESSLREVITTVLPKSAEFAAIGDSLVPLGRTARNGLTGSLTEPFRSEKSKTFAVDVTRLPQDKLRVGTRLAFQRMVEDALPPTQEVETMTEKQVEDIIKSMQEQGIVTIALEESELVFNRLVDAVLDTSSAVADNLFLTVLKRGAEVRPLEVTIDNVAGLYFKGSPNSAEFLLASTQVPRFPAFLKRRGFASFGNENVESLQTELEEDYQPRNKSGKKVNFEKLTAAVTVLFGNGGRFVDSSITHNELTGARLFTLPLIKQLVKRFGFSKDFKLIVLFTDTTENGGFASITREGGVAVLSLNVKRFKGITLQEEQQVELADVIFHEMGHLILGREMMQLKDGELSQVVNAYTRDLFRAELMPIGTAMLQYGAIPDFMSPLVVKKATRRLEATNATLSNTLQSLGGLDNVNYFLNFDEWFANNMAKWGFTREVEPATALEKVMARLGRLLRKYFEFVTGKKSLLFKGVEDFTPDTEFTKFIERIIEKQSETGKPTTQILLNEGRQEVKYSERMNASYEETAVANPSRRLINFVKKVTPKLTKAQHKKLDDTVTSADYFNGLIKWGYNILQVARLNPDIDYLQKYVAGTRRWHVESTQWKARISEVIRGWERLGKVQADALGKFIFEVDNMTYLSKKELNEGRYRRPTADELNALAKKHNLSAQAKDKYQEIVQTFDDFLNVVESVEVKKINKEFAGTPGLDAKLQRSANEFNRLRARPYFPHSRFGQTAIVIKDTDGKTRYMEQVEGPLFSISVKLAEKRKREMLRELNASADMQREMQVESGFVISIVKIPEEAQPFRGMPPSMLRSIEDRLLRVPEGSKSTPQEITLIENQRIWLKELLVDQSPTQSFRKRLGKRENVPGYSQDAMRSYADYFWHGSNYLARLTHGLDMQDTLLEGKAELSNLAAQGVNLVKRRQILEYLEDHYSNIMSPGPDWAQLRSASFSWWLGFVPASALLNFTQVPMVAWPFLSSQYGSIKSLAALKRSYTQLVRLNKNPEKMLAETDDVLFKHLGLAVKQGFIDESWATEIAATATGGNLTRMKRGSLMSRSVAEIGQAAAWMFQASEAKVNRRVVFRAALELARSDPSISYLQELVRTNREEFDTLVHDEGFSETEAKAFLAGRDAVDRSQYEYASWARPRFMRGRLGVLFMFFMFVQNSTYFAIHEPGRIRYMLMLLAMAGVMGLPGAEDMVSIVQFIARRLGMRFNVEEEISRFVVDNFGGDVPPDLLLRGASRFGFGLPAAADMIGVPIPSFDMSASIGMGRLVPGVSEALTPGLDFNRRFSQTTTDIAGATFGIGISFMQYLADSELPWDDPKRFERAMPRALKNVSKMSRFLQEGREKTRGGATIAEFNTDEYEDIGEILLVGAGFQPTKLTRVWDRQQALREVETYWSMRRSILIRQFSIAAMAQDKEAKADMMKAIKRYNDDVPYSPMRITRDSLRRSLKERTRRNRLIEAGVSQQKMFVPLSRDINRLYPTDKGGVVDVQDVSRIR